MCINPAYESAELRHALSLSGAKVILLADQVKDRRLTEVLGRAKGRHLPDLKHSVVINVGGEGEQAEEDGFLKFDDLAAFEADREMLEEVKRRIQPDDPNLIQFTSVRKILSLFLNSYV